MTILAIALVILLVVSFAYSFSLKGNDGPFRAMVTLILMFLLLRGLVP